MNEKEYKMHQKIGLVLGPVAAIVIALLPCFPGLEEVGMKALALTIMMVIWWVSEAVPIWVTALLPIVASIFLGIAGTKPNPDTGIDVYVNYSSAVVMMSIGIFLFAAIIEKWNLHKRIALAIVSKMGNRPTAIIFGFALATGIISMFVSNITAVAMLLPMAIAVINELKLDKRSGFAKALILEIAFAASIGGMGTMIGSGTNVSGVALIKDLAGVEMDFVEWMKVGMPLVIVLLPLSTILVARLFGAHKENLGDVTTIKTELKKLGKMSRGEITAAVVIIVTILGYLFRSKIQLLFPFMSDEGWALVVGVAVFLIPVDWKKGVFLMDGKTAIQKVSWGTFILLGGALSLGAIFKASGITAWIAGGLGFLEALPEIAIVIIVALLVAIITEVCSNFVVVSAFLPMIYGLAVNLGIEPMLLMMVVTLSGSFAYMLPSGTPTNAIAFGTGYIEVKDMIKSGLAVKILSIIVFPILLYLVAAPLTSLF